MLIRVSSVGVCGSDTHYYRHGQVGRHYFGHWTDGAIALFPFDINIWYGTPAQGATVDDWADDNYDHSGLGFIGGSSLHVLCASSSALVPFGSSLGHARCSSS